MAQSPSTIGSALLEPAHLAGLLIALIVLFVTGFSTAAAAGIVGLELFYLLVFAQSAAYKRRVRLKAAQHAIADRDAALEARAAQLRRDDRRRYQGIAKLHRELVTRLEQPESGGPLPVERERLDELQEAALDFSLALQGFREHLQKSDPVKLRQELEARPVATGGGEAADAKRQARELLEQRIQHLEAMQTQVGVLDARLQVIEHTFQLLKEQLSTMGAPSQLRTDVGELVREVEATRRTLQEMQAMELGAGGRLGS